MKIRKFKKQDARKVSNLIIKSQNIFLRKCYSKKIIDMFNRWSTPSHILEKSKDRDLFVAVERNNILGIGGIKDGGVRTLFVNPKYSRKGIARKILEKIEKVAKKKKIKKLKAGSTPYAEEFYKKRGFKRIRKTTWKNEGIKFDVILMEKKL